MTDSGNKLFSSISLRAAFTSESGMEFLRAMSSAVIENEYSWLFLNICHYPYVLYAIKERHLCDLVRLLSFVCFTHAPAQPCLIHSPQE